MAKRARPNVHVGRVTDPDDVADVEKLLAMPDEAFVEEVEFYVTNRGAGRRVFRDVRLVERTYEALRGLQPDAMAAVEGTAKETPERRAAVQYRNRVSAELQELGPFLHKARAEAAQNSPRQRAIRILSELHPVQLREIMRAVEAGKPRQQILDEQRARMRDRAGK